MKKIITFLILTGAFMVTTHSTVRPAVKQDTVKPGIYKHYKGNRYEVIGVGHHTETLEPLVMYRALYDTPDFGPQPLWARPVAMFQETVIFNNIKQPRFTFIEEK